MARLCRVLVHAQNVAMDTRLGTWFVPLLKDLLPGLCAELERDLRAEGEHRIANTVDCLRVYELCPCSDHFCGSFSTAERPDGKYGPGHRNILLNPSAGMTILDVVDGIIKFVELIDRPDIKTALKDAGII